MKPIVALDLDDLIFPFMELFVPYANERHGWQYSIDDYNTFNFEEVWGETREFAVNLSEEFFAQLEGCPDPIDGAASAVEKLAEHYKLAIVTSRTDSMHEITLDWIETHFATTFVEVQLTNGFVTDGSRVRRRKVDVCKELEAVALVDDNLDNVAGVIDQGINGILYGSFPWNQSNELPHGVVRAANWQDVVSILTETK